MKNMIKSALLTVASFAAFSASATMSCYVDTPAYDIFKQNYCDAFIANGPHKTTAVFRIDNPPANLNSVIWSDSSCSQNSTICLVDIQAHRPLTMSATVLKTDGTYYQVSARADYEIF